MIPCNDILGCGLHSIIVRKYEVHITVPKGQRADIRGAVGFARLLSPRVINIIIFAGREVAQSFTFDDLKWITTYSKETSND